MLDPTCGWAKVRQDVGGDMNAGRQLSTVVGDGNLILLPQ